MIVKTGFSNVYNIKRTLKTNLKIDVLKNLTINDLRRKAGKAFVMLKSAYSNREKLKKYQ
jgi:hypothetical protein